MASTLSNESQFVVDLLTTLRHEKFSPMAWACFLARSWEMSRQTAKANPGLKHSWGRVSLALCVLAFVLLAASFGLEGPASALRLLPGFLFCVAWQINDLYWHLGLNRQPQTGALLPIVGLANFCTQLRGLGASFLLGRLVGGVSTPTVLILLIFLCGIITDILDGQIARRTHRQSKLGQITDGEADFCLYLAVTLVLIQNSILPVWIGILMLARFLLPLLAALASYFILAHPVRFGSTVWGKYAGLAQCLYFLVLLAPTQLDVITRLINLPLLLVTLALMIAAPTAQIVANVRQASGQGGGKPRPYPATKGSASPVQGRGGACPRPGQRATMRTRGIVARKETSPMKTEHPHQQLTYVTLDGLALVPEQVIAVARHYTPVELDNKAVARIQAARAVIDTLAAEERKVYGVTTGFGHLSRVRIQHEQLTDLQHNLLRSHSAGVGEPLSEEVTRAMMLLLAASLARGHSGVRVEVVQLLIAMLNARIFPVVPSRGSVGSSGDLAPLAHLGLTLIGEGEAIVEGQQYCGAEALNHVGIEPIALHAKEGLALINGTHLMEAIAVLAQHDAQVLLRAAEVACAMSIEGLMGSHAPLDERIHRRRGQIGQQISAERLRRLVVHSEINVSHADCPRVQDPYTMRCAPQVLGAVRDALDYCAGVFGRELDAVTDNPLVFPDEGDVLSGGNFHGQPLALALDFLAIALAQLASFSERRIFNLMGPHDWDEGGAPLFLTPNPGLNSGFMIAQYVAASLVNEIKVLAHPASIDSIPTSAGMEDFNSMGATSAHKLLRILEEARQVVAIELMSAAQMLEFRKPLKPGVGVLQAYEIVRSYVAKLDHDRVLSPDINALAQAIHSEAFEGIE